MAATSLSPQVLNSQIRRPRPGASTRRIMCNPFSSLPLRAFNGDPSEQSREEEARRGLKQLDEQLSQTSSPSSPRTPFFGEMDERRKKLMSRGSLPEFSDGFLIFLGGGLLLLTVVNNFLFYYFVERPNRDEQVAQQNAEKKLESASLSVDDMKAAPQPQATSDM